MDSRVDILVLLYNSEKWVPSLIESLRHIQIPATLYFLDNDSQDGSAEAAVRGLEKLAIPGHVLRSPHNLGFAGGVNLLAHQTSAEFLFILNPDTELQPGCLQALVARALADPRIGICEARQSPREHWKAVDRSTGETSWCSGAAALIRRAAFDEVGGFDDRLYFMYCEDVDLSWKFWLKDWKCVYVPEAVVRHHTQDLDPGKRRTRENYFTFRNSLFLLYRFGAWSDRRVFWNYLLKRFASPKYSVKSRVLFAIALVEHVRYIPYLLQTRGVWNNRRHSWIRFEQTSLSH